MKATAFLWLALLPAFSIHANAQVITSTVYGVVTDPTGASIGNAKVTVTSEETGATASVTTDAAGEFTLASLQPGRYDVSIEAQGFKNARQSGLALASGARIRTSFQLEVGSMATQVEVTASAPLVNAVNAEQRTNLEMGQVRELPTTRRDWTGLLQLNPGVAVSSSAGTVSLNGLAPASFRITVDGTDSASDTELPSLSMYQNFNFVKGVSLEAIEEVNVAKGIASAEIANTMSGNVNINTKRGTNEYHGSLFWLNQTENLNARNQFLPNKPPLVYNQYGGSGGGAIVKNKLFAFGVFEAYRLRGFQALNGNVPTPEFRARAIAAVPAYKPFLDLYPAPNTAYAPNAVAAQWVGSGTEKGQDNHAVIRGDYHINNSLILTARYTRGRPYRETPRVAAPNYRFWTGASEIGSANLTYARPHWTSETRFGINYNRVNRVDNIYELGISGIAGGLPFTSGGETFFKEGQNWTAEEVIGTTIGRHSLRMGMIYGSLWAGRENIQIPDVGYANDADFLANLPNSVTVTFGVKQFRATTFNLGFFVQDDFKVSRRLVLNMGVRWDYYAVPNERDKRLFNRDEPFGFGGYRNADTIWNAKYTNFSPRIGLAYSLDDSSKTVIRTGAGVFYNPRPMFGGPVDLVQNALDEPFRNTYSRADVLRYPDLLKYPVVNDKVLTIAKGGNFLPSGTAINPDWGYPHSYQWTLSVQRQLARDLAAEVTYVGTRGLGLMMVRTMNPPDRLTGVRPNPGFLTFRYRDGSEQTNYHGLQMSLRKRFAMGLNFNGNYTWSKNLSYSSDADLLLPASPQDIWNVNAEYGPSNIDVRHRFTLDYLYELPFAKLANAGSRPGKLLLSGWQLAGVLTAQTGDPLNVTQPSSLDSSRPDYISGAPVLDNSRTTLQYINPAAFARVPLSSVSGLPIRPGSLGRNALRNPGLWNIDMTLAKLFAMTERFNLQLRFELLNAFNHTNLSGINGNIVQSNFGRATSTRGARLLQYGLRFSF